MSLSYVMTRPQNIGIKGLEVYIPTQYVQQSELEEFDGIPAGKYTIGLGQTKMSFVNDREDIYSMALTTVSRLLKNYNVDPASVGRLEVGTETLLDKSKSVKSVLMQLFGDNADIEGVDTVNACYGGTSALFNAYNWIDSSAWDGRLAVVVAGDIAIYAKGNARPTGGAGVVAMLVGPDAPLVIEPTRASYMEHAYDFYKPDFTSEYPLVDGQFSLACYTKAVDKTYGAYNKKAKNTGGMGRFDYSAFHVPTCKQAAKSFARLYYNDYLADPAQFKDADIPKEVSEITYEGSLTDKNLEKLFMGLTKAHSKKNFSPSIEAATNVGNIYTGSLYLSLASLVCFVPADELAGKRISMFSYGSGLAASFFAIKVTDDVAAVKKLAEKVDLREILEKRTKITPHDYEAALSLREKAHLKKDFKPTGSTEHLLPGTYYLEEIDDKFRRKYGVKN